MGRPKKRPEPFRISGSDVRVRVHSGPDAEGRWRWRAERTVEGKAITVWSGWGSQEEAERQILALLAAPPAPPEPEGLVSVRDLLETWALAQDERMDTSDHTKRSATTGARIGEIASLKWASVSADCAWIDVKGKTGARRVPLHPSVAVEVQGWERGEPTDLVLGVSYNTAVARTQRELGRVSEEVLKIPRVSPNGLRRAMVDALYRAGVPIDVEAALLGHSPQTAIAIYRRVADEDRASAVVRAGVPLPVAPAGQVVPFTTRGGKE